MVREPFLRVRFLLIAMLALVATDGATAQPNTMSNIILVHGAWADGSSWSRVIPLLEARGLNVTAVQLPLTSLADDVATTKRAIAHMEAQHPGPIVLVGHSYGGVVIGEAGNDPNVVAVEQDFAQCLPEVQRDVLTATQGPTSGAALTDAAISPAWKTKPSWFIVAKHDRVIPPDLEETEAATIGARTITPNTCHLAMLDLPSKVAAVIADAAGGQ
jgi:pimeloyl-ACP methyl ester carboxylesterase